VCASLRACPLLKVSPFLTFKWKAPVNQINRKMRHSNLKNHGGGVADADSSTSAAKSHSSPHVSINVRGRFNAAVFHRCTVPCDPNDSKNVKRKKKLTEKSFCLKKKEL
jgi:hypothetical protein